LKETIIIEIDCNNIQQEKLERCAQIIKSGGTVAFPTETVYGLGANALDPTAIEKIFLAKGRPSDNPLIVHVARADEVKPLIKYIPEKAVKAMECFWPGPLTIVFEKSDLIPEAITGGLSTVAIRVPSHPIALKLIELAGIPIAAPSANLSGKPSPTKGEHVVDDLTGKADAIIIGGNCTVGVESTVLDMTGEIPVILRPGGVTKEMLEEVLGTIEWDAALDEGYSEKSQPKSPGMKYTHYAPKAQVFIIKGQEDKTTQKIKELIRQYKKEGKKIGIICFDETDLFYENVLVKSMGSKAELHTVAANLFSILREFDETDTDVILAEAVVNIGLGQAIMNRLIKAAGYKVINV
jgi:L-threonylcarbamoyladenylate synthase